MSTNQTLVLSLNSLRIIPEDDQYLDLVSESSVERNLRANQEIAEVHQNGIRFFVTAKDLESSRLAVIRTNELFWSLTPSQRIDVFERCRRFVERAADRPVRIHPSWRFYKDGDLADFFALPINKSKSNPRWIVKYQPSDTILFWDLYGTDGPVRLLQDEKIDASIEGVVRSSWIKALQEAQSLFAHTTHVPQQGIVTLGAPLSSNQWTKPRTFEEWMEDGVLTRDQRDFVESVSESIRLKGPAGSGKTLALELKAIYQTLLLIKQNIEPQILFATHNWATAEQVTDDIDLLDTAGVKSFITVAPLLQVIEEIRPLPDGVGLLGSDPEEDRDLQVVLLKEAISQFKQEEYLRFRTGCSNSFQNEIEKDVQSSADSSSFENDLLTEFAVVLGGEGIQLHKVDEIRYLDLQRQSRWLELNRSELQCVYGIYKRFMTLLMNERLITSDQFLLTSSQWFNGFEWGPMRRSKGFDLIFVDELHKFSSIERRILNHLSRDAFSYPRLFMSLDPNQSPNGRYGSGVEDRAFDDNQQDVIEFREIHRYSPQILDLIKHINRTVPTEDFGQLWSVDIESSQSLAQAGPRPLVLESKSGINSVSTISFDEANKGNLPSSRVAVIVMDEDQFPKFAELAERISVRRQVTIVKNRDELGTVSRAKRNLVVGTPETLAGLQFEYVIVSGFSDCSTYEKNDSKRIDFLSKLYLAVSRSSSEVIIVIDSERHGIPEVLWSAHERNVVSWTEV